MAKHFSQDKHYEILTFDELEDINTPTSIEQARFMELLNVPHDRLPKPPKRSDGHLTYKRFLVAVNHMAKSIQEMYFADRDTLVFKSTPNQPHGGRITNTKCRPDFIAAFKREWKTENATLWPYIRLVGEDTSSSEKSSDQEKHAASYLYYLLLARPDLYVTQGLFTSNSKITFLFGIGGNGVQKLSVPWESQELHRLMYAFIYRLYEPGHFADSSYVEMVPDVLDENSVTFTVRMSGIDDITPDGNSITNLIPIYANNPFGTRTHILLNHDSKLKFKDKPMVVLKDQLCRNDTRFNEYDILARVHDPEEVPGVVEAVYHDLIKIPGDFCQFRTKHRLGLNQIGRPFTSIPTVGQMLEIVFDILEVLRYLRFERNVLHRDISKGNVLYIEGDTLSSTGDDVPAGSDGKELPLCFIQYLLGKSKNPRQTSALLIDFNHAEDLGKKQGNEHKRVEMTGTPVFIARAVQLRGPVLPLTLGVIVPPVPISPEHYTTCHPDRIRTFPDQGMEMLQVPEEAPNIQWRHELNHDTESVFWLLFYWLVSAQPENAGEQEIGHGIWTGLTGNVWDRVRLLRGGTLVGATHSVYEPLRHLLDRLARILDVDRNWLKWIKPSDPRGHPAYVNEAFQRLILQFIVEHQTDEFMHRKVSPRPRRIEDISQHLGSGSMFSSSLGKRPEPEPETQVQPSASRIGRLIRQKLESRSQKSEQKSESSQSNQPSHATESVKRGIGSLGVFGRR